jgi:hypothetical protein
VTCIHEPNSRGIWIAVHLDVLNVLAKRKLKALVFQGVDHANAIQKGGLAEFWLLLEQKMRHDGGPLMVATLEFVFKCSEITVLD